MMGNPHASSPAQPASSAARRPSSVIGLLGGSFDPIHNGHLTLAHAALAGLQLAELRLLPAGQPWQKATPTEAAHRARMVQLALADPCWADPRLMLDMREIERDGPTYTVDTLRELRAQLGPQIPLVLVLGADQFARLDTWHAWPQIIGLAHLAVARRNGEAPALTPALRALKDEFTVPAATALTRPAGSVIELPMPPVDVSATELRALLAQPAPDLATQKRLATALPDPVLDYIRTHHLYR